jgi:hypothetical protein
MRPLQRSPRLVALDLEPLHDLQDVLAGGFLLVRQPCRNVLLMGAKVAGQRGDPAPLGMEENGQIGDESGHQTLRLFSRFRDHWKSTLYTITRNNIGHIQ